MKRYWLKFKVVNGVKFPPGTKVGCGVTANSKEDAISLVKQFVFKSSVIPELELIRSNVEIEDLDQNHVIPNMGNPALRGVWFPFGYDSF